jgi:hypothetical protein
MSAGTPGIQIALPFISIMYIQCPSPCPCPGSTPSSILAGMPPPSPKPAAASMRAIFALCELVFRPCGDICCCKGTDFVLSATVPVLSRPASELREVECAGEADSLSDF